MKDPVELKADPARCTREVWEIANDMQSMPDSMHLHGFQFRVVERRTPRSTCSIATISSTRTRE